MKRKYAAIAVPVMVCGAAFAGASQASAQNVDPGGAGSRDTVTFVDVPGPTQEVQVDDALAETLQTSAGAVGGAALAIASLWLYRRRHPIPVH